MNDKVALGVRNVESYTTAVSLDLEGKSVSSNNSIKEIDLAHIVYTLWKSRWLILSFAVVASILSILYALSIQDFYRAEVLLTHNQKAGSSLSGQIPSEFAGLASIAGIGNQGSKIDMTSMATLTSKRFIIDFVDRHQLSDDLDILPLKQETGDAKAIDGAPSVAIKNAQRQGLAASSRDWAIYNAFMNVLDISIDSETGLITLAVELNSTEKAATWANQLVEDINSLLRQQEIDKAQRSIQYLESQLKNTQLVAMQQSIFQLIESQLKLVMLAKVDKEFAFKVIDPAISPSLKAGPNRKTIVIMGATLGVVLCFIWIGIYSLRKGIIRV